MPKNLLIVESPTKAKTIGKYLGSDFRIMASVGHLKDLPPNKLGVNVENHFQPEYVTIKGKSKILNELQKASKDVESVFLAPDPDREGEAIAWHIAEEIKGSGKKIYRVLFNELTSKAIKEAIASPLSLNRDRFESQQARRILDRLVGYQISPLLWSKVKRGLSAGRVQSVSLRIICEREREIHAFVPQEYWSLTANLQADDPPPFKAKLIRYMGDKIELRAQDQTQDIADEVKEKAFEVEKVIKKKVKRNPPPPFTTSLLQQEAFKKLNFPARKTMSIAQNLYEGIALGEKGQVGLITYMRTDSFRLSSDAIAEARDYISSRFGYEYLPEKPHTHRSPKGAQEAHEAIRPTSVLNSPDSVSPYLTKDQSSLYGLIWRRFVACQMSPAIMEQTQADIKAGNADFRATGSVVLFKGFTTIYEISMENSSEKGSDGILPPLKKGQILQLIDLESAQHFTQPPPRFSEASLIKELEEKGIGRPSTYATILGNIQERDYVTLEKGRFKPTELGFLIADLLVSSFPEIMDIDFTAQMEQNLDKIERGEAKWTKVLQSFYTSFEKELKKAQKEMKGESATDIPCPKCGKPLKIKAGRNGLFLGCSDFPQCKYTANFTREDNGKITLQEKTNFQESGESCEICGRPMIEKIGRFGPFLACSGYPECKNTRRMEKETSPNGKGVPCPNEGCHGLLVERISKKNRKFYACNQYPRCHFAMWDPPFDDVCPLCGTQVLRIKSVSGTEAILACRKKGCKFTRSHSLASDH